MPRPTRAAGRPSCGRPRSRAPRRAGRRARGRSSGPRRRRRCARRCRRAAVWRITARRSSRIAGGHGARMRSTRSATARFAGTRRSSRATVSTTSPLLGARRRDAERELARAAAVARVLGDHRAGRAGPDRVPERVGEPRALRLRADVDRGPAPADPGAERGLRRRPRPRRPRRRSRPRPCRAARPARPSRRPPRPPRRSATPAASAVASSHEPNVEQEPLRGRGVGELPAGRVQERAADAPVGADLHGPGLEADAAARPDLALVGAHHRDRAVGPDGDQRLLAVAEPQRQHRERAVRRRGGGRTPCTARARPPARRTRGRRRRRRCRCRS